MEVIVLCQNWFPSPQPPEQEKPGGWRSASKLPAFPANHSSTRLHQEEWCTFVRRWSWCWDFRQLFQHALLQVLAQTLNSVLSTPKIDYQTSMITSVNIGHQGRCIKMIINLRVRNTCKFKFLPSHCWALPLVSVSLNVKWGLQSTALCWE